MKIIQQWKEQPDKSYRVIAFGSSNTELSWSNNGRHNWVDWLSINLRDSIGHHVSVVNQGIGGETSDHLLARIDRDVLSFQPSVVIVTIGGNDALTDVPLERYVDNLQKICTLILNQNAQPVLQTYYCPMYHMGNSGFKNMFESFMESKRAVAREMGLLLVDQYTRFEPFYSRDPESYGRLMNDWIHVNHLGNLFMGQYISSCFGLPDLQIPQDIRQQAVELGAMLLADDPFAISKLHPHFPLPTII